jgi:hypothetical protein
MVKERIENRSRPKSPAHAHTGRTFEHRRGWAEGRLLELAQIFAIEVCGYAILANTVTLCRT